MVILSDGDDNQSRWTREQALEMAHKGDVVIYAISTNRSGIETDGDKVLKYFRAGNRRPGVFPFKAQDMAQDFEKYRQRIASSIQRPVPSGTIQAGRSLSRGEGGREKITKI